MLDGLLDDLLSGEFSPEMGRNSPQIRPQESSKSGAFRPFAPFAHRHDRINDSADDRRTCFVCLNFRAGRCLAAWRGELPNTSRKYRPDPERLRRCDGYQPGTDDPDRRHGWERWPGLTRQEAVR